MFASLIAIHIFYIGAKTSSPCSFGHTQFHLVPDRYRRDRMVKLDLADQIEVFLRANGIASLFAWTGAQAMYQGNPMSELHHVSILPSVCVSSSDKDGH